MVVRTTPANTAAQAPLQVPLLLGLLETVRRHPLGVWASSPRRAFSTMPTHRSYGFWAETAEARVQLHNTYAIPQEG